MPSHPFGPRRYPDVETAIEEYERRREAEARAHSTYYPDAHRQMSRAERELVRQLRMIRVSGLRAYFLGEYAYAVGIKTGELFRNKSAARGRIEGAV